MLTKEIIRERLRNCRPFLEGRFGVASIGLFGSYARGEQKDDSDVDLLVTFERPIGWDFIDLKDFLEQTLGTRVDLVTIGALKPRLKEKILREVDVVYR